MEQEILIKHEFMTIVIRHDIAGIPLGNGVWLTRELIEEIYRGFEIFDEHFGFKKS